jgi:hypothetical protein
VDGRHDRDAAVRNCAHYSGHQERAASVEAAGGFVEEKDAREGDQLDGNCEALALLHTEAVHTCAVIDSDIVSAFSTFNMAMW